MKRLFVVAFFTLLSVSTPTHAQAPTTAPIQLLAANLTMPLDASRAKVGTRFQANVASAWTGNGCELRVGAVVEGHVSQVEHRSKSAPRSAMHLVIDTAECDRKKGTPLKVSLFALIGPADAPPGMGKSRSLTDQPVLTGYANSAAPTVAQSPSSGFRSVEASAAINQNEPTGRRLPAQWKPGMVVDVPMNLAVGTGVDGGSILWTTNTDARLEAQTTLILSATSAPAPTSPANP